MFYLRQSPRYSLLFSLNEGDDRDDCDAYYGVDDDVCSHDDEDDDGNDDDYDDH